LIYNMSELVTKYKSLKKKGKPKKLSTRVDFTPMVDLGFLLVTFFMLSTTLNKPQTMEISMPSKDKVAENEQTQVKESNAVTILLGKNDKIYYYFGIGTTEVTPKLNMISFAPDGIRNVLLQRNIDLVNQIRNLKIQKTNRSITEEEFKKKVAEVKQSKQAPVVMIKSTDEATYENLVDILDEMQICNIARYAIVDITGYDKELITNFENQVSVKL
jgi:biopolymer transport protein ExbD